nr:E3 ubiquitin-protein ligase E3D-like isoform X1 [Leptinotarsa decemlineata]
MSSASGIFQTIILELRPRLQSVNAFVSLSKEPESVEVVLGKESIRVITDKGLDEIPCGDINAVQCSLSGMKICDKFLTFRFATNNPLEIGGFKTELLQNTVASIESLSNKPLLSNNTAYTIQCLNCGKSLTDSVKFDRVLPLPSENSDASDWFCHGHGNQMNGFSLNPKKTDCFYSQCFVHIHSESVANVKCSGKLAVCRFCLQWLGIQQNPTTIRLWFNTVKFVGSNSCVSTSSLQDAFKTIRNSFKYSVHSTVRVILTCQTSSSQVDAVLIWILEKNLQILFNGSGSVKKHEVAKVLFKLAGSDEPTLKMWQDDAMVSSFSVSKIMMVDLLKHLHKFNKMFPSEYSKSNEFKISYLLLYD